MTFAIVAAVVATSSVYTAVQQRKAGKAQAEQVLIQKQQEEMQAKVEELSRREQLNATLAANQAAMATSGVSGLTPESVALESARQVSSSESAIGLSNRLKLAMRERQAANISATGRAQATGTLLSGAAQAASGYAAYNAPTPTTTTG
jgi:hypothetical protein